MPLHVLLPAEDALAQQVGPQARFAAMCCSQSAPAHHKRCICIFCSSLGIHNNCRHAPLQLADLSAELLSVWPPWASVGEDWLHAPL